MGLSIATLQSQRHQVTAVDVIPEKIEKSITVSDEYIENIKQKRTEPEGDTGRGFSLLQESFCDDCCSHKP